MNTMEEELYKEALETAHLLARHINDSSTVDEEKRVDAWRSSSENDRLYNEIRNAVSDREIRRGDVDHEWGRFVSRVVGRSYSKRFVFYRIGRIAVAVAILFSGLYYYYGREKESSSLTESVVADIYPPSKVIMLRLSDGEEIALTGEGISIQQEQGADIIGGSGELVYHTEEVLDTSVKYNELYVPQGGSYFLILSDGTRVTLNSMTSIKYPVNFSHHERRVELKGEAYFDVKQDIEKPFFVKTDDYEVQVFGTSFNVNCYADQRYAHVTLVKGNVRVEQQDLTPGGQFLYDKMKGTGRVRIVDTDIYTSWMDGFFSFQSEKLEEIFRMIQKKYDVQVSFLDRRAAEEIFTGKLPFFNNLQVILDQIARVSDVTFTCHNKTIYVRSQAK